MVKFEQSNLTEMKCGNNSSWTFHLPCFYAEQVDLRFHEFEDREVKICDEKNLAELFSKSVYVQGNIFSNYSTFEKCFFFFSFQLRFFNGCWVLNEEQKLLNWLADIHHLVGSTVCTFWQFVKFLKTLNGILKISFFCQSHQ